MSTETASLPFNLTEGYENLDGPLTGSASERLTLAHAQLHTTLMDREVDADLRQYGSFIDALIATIELLDLPADAQLATITDLLFVPPAGDEHPYPDYDLLACLLVTMKVLKVTRTNVMAEYIEAVDGQINSDMFEDEVENRTLRPGLLDATIDGESPTIN